MNRRTFLGMDMPIPTIGVEVLEINERIVLDGTHLSWYDFPEHDDFDVLCWDVNSVYDNSEDYYVHQAWLHDLREGV